MRPPSRLPRWPSALILPLALWSAVPRVQWCPIGWDEVRAECLTGWAGQATPASCAAGLARREGDPECTARACDAELPSPLGSAPADEYPGGRAYCLGGPSGGDGLPPVASAAPDAPVPAAVLPTSTPITATPTCAVRPVIAEALHPPPSPAGAIPRVRAPPGIDRTT